MRLKNKEELGNALKEKQDPRSALPPGQRGRSLLLGKIDLMVQHYLRICNYIPLYSRVPNNFFPTLTPPQPLFFEKWMPTFQLFLIKSPFGYQWLCYHGKSKKSLLDTQ